MKNSTGAAVLLPLVSSLIVIIICVVNIYWVGKSNTSIRNPALQYDISNRSCKSLHAAEEGTCTVNYPTCSNFDPPVLIMNIE